MGSIRVLTNISTFGRIQDDSLKFWAPGVIAIHGAAAI